MPIVAAKLKQAIQTRLFNAFMAEFKDETKDNPKAQDSYKRQAKVIAELAEDICLLLTVDAAVLPGIAVTTAGTPVAQSGATVSPGKIG